MALYNFLYLSSDDSATYYPNNNPADFHVKILNPMIFRAARLCSLVSFQYHDSFAQENGLQSSYLNFYVCSNICQHSFVSDSTLPVLNRIKVDITNDAGVKEVTIANPLYVPIVEYFTDDIHIYIKGDNESNISFLKGPTKLTLQLRY